MGAKHEEGSGGFQTGVPSLGQLASSRTQSGFPVSTGLCGAQAGCRLQASPASSSHGLDWAICPRSCEEAPKWRLQTNWSAYWGHPALCFGDPFALVSWGVLAGVRRESEVRSYNCPCYPSILGKTTSPSPSLTASTHPTREDVHILIPKSCACQFTWEEEL